ncbi:uncharacterized protein LOC129840515 isoform X1 [Salvelinus fontinalis]|uniref:uncharacterized protein LOC129840515 isoform X1 n=1 Tax=Salvelinus fontinalis TaxID=8038 RepID=UPI0024866CB9|nr:uncharacterized protein LOC129840515 isoform X1 [Salvelinus fontinalis]XP_055764411.1 uncharacterized protein LOC129840515 isoform X1 [Salvelinus fontinalis]
MIFLGFLVILTSVQAVSRPTFSPVYELKVRYGDNVTLPCTFSSYLGQEDRGEVRWEAMGQEVASMEVGNILGEARWDDGAKGVEVKTTLGFSSRVEFPPAERMRDGDFSMTIQETVLSDEEMYECIWLGRKTISTVWLKVQEPDPPRSITLFKGSPVTLPCYGVIPKTQPTSQIYVQWLKDDVEIMTLNPGPDDKGPKEEDLRLSLPPNNLLENGDLSLFIYKTELKDQGVYRCFYKSRGFEDPKSGIPEDVYLTILDPHADLYNLTGTENVTSSSDFSGTSGDSENPITFFTLVTQDKEDMQGTSSEPILVQTEMTPSSPDATFEDLEDVLAVWAKTLPLVRIGIITGVLLVTALIFFPLLALNKIPS